jgi:hypothetical protein
LVEGVHKDSKEGPLNHVMGRSLQVLVLPRKILVVVVVPLEVADVEHLGSFQVEEQCCQGSLHTEVFLVVHSLNLEGICFQGLHTLGCGLQEQDIQVDHTEKEIKKCQPKDTIVPYVEETVIQSG